jgi:hypothetical protein
MRCAVITGSVAVITTVFLTGTPFRTGRSMTSREEPVQFSFTGSALVNRNLLERRDHSASK